MNEAIVKIIPILLLILFGKLIRSKNWIDSKTADVLKLGIIKIGLPTVLFLTFKNMDIQKAYLLLSVISFCMIGAFYIVGSIVNRVFKLNNIILPFIVTGFSFGLLGVPLFEGVYGIENLSDLSIIGIGNEFFLWFVYISIFRAKLGNQKFSMKLVWDFAKSPIIIAIIGGLAVNLGGFSKYFDEIIILQGLSKTLEYFATMTTPLMLIIIGYGIKLDKKCLKDAMKIVMIRLVIVFGIGYLTKLLIINPFIHNASTVFDLAFFTFLALPPPFSLAIFMGDYCSEEEITIANNAIVLSTILCLILFAGMVILTSL
jgi:predicted permease